jgi:hypothetical protein
MISFQEVLLQDLERDLDIDFLNKNIRLRWREGFIC